MFLRWVRAGSERKVPAGGVPVVDHRRTQDKILQRPVVATDQHPQQAQRKDDVADCTQEGDERTQPPAMTVDDTQPHDVVAVCATATDPAHSEIAGEAGRQPPTSPQAMVLAR